ATRRAAANRTGGRQPFFLDGEAGAGKDEADWGALGIAIEGRFGSLLTADGARGPLPPLRFGVARGRTFAPDTNGRAWRLRGTGPDARHPRAVPGGADGPRAAPDGRRPVHPGGRDRPRRD